LPWGDVITRDNHLYLLVYDWPRDGKLWLYGLESGIRDSRLLEGSRKKKVKWTKEGDWTCLKVPFQAPDDPVSVIELTTRDEPAADSALFADPQIGLTLSAMMGTAEKGSVEKMAWMDSKFGDWRYAYGVDHWEPETRLKWDFVIKDPGYYQIALKYKGKDHVVWKITSDEGHLVQNQQNASTVYTSYPIGWMRFDQPGRHSLQVGLVQGLPETTLIEMTLTPVRL
jgi:alpha-L-fucosidase